MAKKDKHTGGKLAANFRKANIAEGLAIQMFRPFSAISPVPREEDYGIDFIGTLIRRQGLTLTAEDSFVVQIKIVSAAVFSFAGDGVEWLRNLKLPYFPVVVDLNKGEVSVYTLNSYHQPLFASIVTKYNFVVQNEYNEGDGLDDFPLGDPILRWSLNDCIHDSFPVWAYNVFSPIVKIESNNFKYGRFNRFEMFDKSTYQFDPENLVTQPIDPAIDIFHIPPGEAEAIRSTMEAVIGPFAYLMGNQIYNDGKDESLLSLRKALRDLNFEPDPHDEWSDIAQRMNDPY